MPAPGIIHRERFTNSGPIRGEEGTIAAFLVNTRRGPHSEPTLVESFSEFLEIFGGFQTSSDATYAIKGFFEEGGQKAYIVRLVNYTSPTSTSPTLSLTKASDTVQDPSADDIFDIDALHVGDYGNDVEYKLSRNARTSTTLATDASSSDTSIEVTSPEGIHAGQILELDDGTNTEYVKVASVSTDVSSGSAVHTVTLTSSIGTSTFLTATPTNINSLEFDVEIFYEESASAVETFEQVSLESELDSYIETVMNDEESGSIYVEVTVDSTNTLLSAGYGTPPVTDTYYPSAVARTALSGATSLGTITAGDLAGAEGNGVGIHALDAQDDVRLVAAINDADDNAYEPVFLHEALNFCENRTNCFLLAMVDDSDAPGTAITNKASDGLGNSDFGAIFYNRIKVVDPEGTTRFVNPLGHVAGRFVLEDNRADQGPWIMAAGDRGLLTSALEVERALSDTQRDNLNDAGIIPITKVRGRGIQIFGARTMNPDSALRYVNTRRSLIYIQQSVNEGLGWVAFRNNDSSLWGQIRSSLEQFLVELMEDGAIKGTDPSEAFSIKVGETDGVQTVADTNSGKVISEIGVALQRPAEFVYFDWSEQIN